MQVGRVNGGRSVSPVFRLPIGESAHAIGLWDNFSSPERIFRRFLSKNGNGHSMKWHIPFTLFTEYER